MTLLLIFLSFYIGINTRFSIVLGILELLILLVFAFFKIKKKTAFVLLFVSLVGLGISFIRPSFVKEEYGGVVTEVRENYFILSSSLEKFYISEPNNYREIGDIISVKGNKKELSFITLESEFDFKDYLNRKGIYSELEVTEIKVKFSSPIRLHKFKKDTLEKFDDNTRGLVSSILFAYGGEGETTEVGNSIHLMRLISASGVYLYFFYKLIKKLLSLFIKKEKIVDLLTIILLSPYLIITFPRFVVVKFFTLRTLMYINEHALKKRFTYLDVLSFTGIVFLLIDYHLARQDGFLLTYLIPIVSLFINGSFHFQKKMLQRIFIFLVITIFFVPFTVKYYSEISPLSPVVALIITPFFILISILSILGILNLPLYKPIGVMNALLTNILKFFNSILPKIYVPPMSDAGIIIYELIFILLLYFLSIRLRPIKNVFVGLMISFMSVYILPISFLIRDYVTFINVGQGDSTLIKYKTTTVLIDTGGNKYKDIATEVLIPFFKKKQIYELDLVITTHDDFDHSGALTSLVENFKVKRYEKDYLSFPLNIGGLTITNYNVYPELWKEENDYSLVLGFKVNSNNYLVMGDAPKSIENAIMKNNKYIPCDILKIGHHGSKTSTSEEFIKYLRPTIGVISCGKNNFYGHPHSEVIAILNKYHVSIRRTDLESSITF